MAERTTTAQASRPRWWRDSVLFLRATLTNGLARLTPGLYTRLTGETGRGRGDESAHEVADYFRDCVRDYRAVLERAGVAAEALESGTVVEYGPGDIPGVALLLYAQGAREVICVDRFALLRPSAFNRAVREALAEPLTNEAHQRFREADDAVTRFDSGRRPPAPVSYRLQRDGLARLKGVADVAVSRAVLEHVNDLAATYRDMFAALRPGGIAAHKVDLRSHGLHRDTPLDFLNWPSWAWWCMHSGKGTPNRWRLDSHRAMARDAGFEILRIEPVLRFDDEELAQVAGSLAGVAARTPPADLAVATFWIVVRKP